MQLDVLLVIKDCGDVACTGAIAKQSQLELSHSEEAELKRFGYRLD